MNDVKINIQNKTITLTRLKLRGWSRLESLKKDMDDAISKDDYDTYFDKMVEFVEMASSTSEPIDWKSVAWFDFLAIYNMAIQSNVPTIEFPIFRAKQEEQKELPWEYDGRSWFFWLNLFSRNYGWSIEQIENLDIDEAIGLYQEIEIDNQMKKEWEWGLTEISYEYNPTTKMSTLRPLPRPEWMKPIAPQVMPKVKMRREHLPVGNVKSIFDVQI